MNEFKVGAFTIHVFEADQPDAPVVYLHGLEGLAVGCWPSLKEATDGNLSLVAITVPLDDWSQVLAPWSTPEGWPQYVACTKGAESYLKVLTEQIVLQAESFIKNPGERVLAGYSLAGLFTIWAFFYTDLFTKAATASASLWFPGFEKWFMDHSMKRLPEAIYFSCSVEEFDSDNPYLAPEKPTTLALVKWFQEHKVPTTLVLDPCNHYEDVVRRTKASILWTLAH